MSVCPLRKAYDELNVTMKHINRDIIFHNIKTVLKASLVFFAMLPALFTLGFAIPLLIGKISYLVLVSGALLTQNDRVLKWIETPFKEEEKRMEHGMRRDYTHTMSNFSSRIKRAIGILHYDRITYDGFYPYRRSFIDEQYLDSFEEVQARYKKWWAFDISHLLCSSDAKKYYSGYAF